MKRKIRTGGRQKSRLALTALFSVVIFLYIFITSLIVGGILLYLVRHNLLMPGEEIPRPEIIIFHMILWSTCLGVLLSILLSRLSLYPVNKVINAMNDLAHGNFRTRLTFHSGLRHYPTAEEVSDSFNHMAGELEKTEMLRADFVNNFSHEFKTPIVSIAGFADLLREEALTERERQEYICIIAEEAHRLADMATNVLNLTRIENQTILTEVTEFNLSEQIRGCLLLLENKWTEKGLSLDVDLDEYFYSGNKELMKQVWLNLIDNAVKFADEGGTLQITVTETAENLIVSVGDTGQEIPKESMGRIFNKFYQADESHAAQGNGIGLSIVRAVVGLHGGEVIPSSGGGKTVFTVVLPRRKDGDRK